MNVLEEDAVLFDAYSHNIQNKSYSVVQTAEYFFDIVSNHQRAV